MTPLSHVELALGLLSAVALVLGAMALARAGEAIRLTRVLGTSASGHPQPSLPRALPPETTAELQALRADVRRLESELERLLKAAGPPPSGPAQARHAPDAAGESAAPEPADPEPTPALDAEPVPRGLPVEFDGESLRLSRSLSALGSLVVEDGAGGRARLFLNDGIQIDHVAFERWSSLFDFRGGKPYACYRTIRPAVVEWDEEAGRGRPVSRGVAEVVA